MLGLLHFKVSFLIIKELVQVTLLLASRPNRRRLWLRWRLLCLFDDLRCKCASFKLLLLLFLAEKFQALFTLPLLVFDAAFDLIRIKTTGGLVAIMLLFLDSHEVLLRDQDVRTLLLLVVELLDQFAIGLVEVLFLLWVDMSCFPLS